MNRIGQLTLAALAALAVPVTPARAADAVQISVAPLQLSGGARPVAFFDGSVKPGATFAGRLTVRNVGRRRADVALDPVPALTTQNLGSGYAVRGARTAGPATWLRLSRRRVTVAPGASVAVAVAVHVPTDAAPGDYLSGVSVQALNQGGETSSARRGTMIVSARRYAIGTLIRVPGPRHPLLRLSGASVSYSASGVTFHLRASNAGNALLRNVRGSVTIRSAGRTVLTAPIGPGTFVENTAIDLPIVARRQHPSEDTAYDLTAVLHYQGRVARLHQVVRFPHHAAEVQHEYGGGPAVTSRLPVVVFGVGGAALLLALVALLAARRRRARHAPSLAQLQAALAEHGLVITRQQPQDAPSTARIIAASAWQPPA